MLLAIAAPGLVSCRLWWTVRPRPLVHTVPSALVVTVALSGAPLAAEQAAAPAANAVQGALVKDLGNLSDKFVGLARVMAGKYDWKPGQGVRSVAEVFNLIVNENNARSSGVVPPWSK